MGRLLLNQVAAYIEEHIEVFHQTRLTSIERLQLDRILRRKNPYLFKAKNMLTSQQIAENIVTAHLSSHEESIFGNWLEGLALFVSQTVCGGWKSGIAGVDLEFNRQGKRYIVSIKSGPSWGNSSQQEKMKSDFARAARTLRSSDAQLEVVAVNGCCYGRDNQPDKGTYLKLCGERFWSFLSGDAHLYLAIIHPLGERAKEKTEAFARAYAQKVNLLTLQFSETFCDAAGAIVWEEILRFNSGIQPESAR